MTFPRGLRALNHRDFRLFWLGQMGSQVGTWMHAVAQAWLVLQLTGSAFRLGLVGTLQWGPMLVLSPLAGVLADRWPRRWLLLATQTTLGLQALALAALVTAGAVEYWHVAALALVMGLANVVDVPARQSFVTDMVGRADLVNAISLNAAVFNAARVVGPALGGVLIARLGVGPVFLVNGLSFAIVLAALGAVRTPGIAAGQRAPLLGALAEALRYVLGTPQVRVVFLMLSVVSLCVFNFNVFVPLLARQALGLGARGFGFLMAAVGVGAVAGALALAARRGQPPLRLIAGAGTTACAGILALAATRGFGAALVLLFLVGLASISFMAACNTSVQVRVPDAMRGRVMGLYTTIFGGMFPVGAFVTGSLAEAFGIRTALAVNGGAGLLGLGLVALWWRRAGRRYPPRA